jgi:hypothetical protein
VHHFAGKPGQKDARYRFYGVILVKNPVYRAGGEYYETLELERQLAENSATATEWVSHQLAAADEERVHLVEANDE